MRCMPDELLLIHGSAEASLLPRNCISARPGREQRRNSSCTRAASSGGVGFSSSSSRMRSNRRADSDIGNFLRRGQRCSTSMHSAQRGNYGTYPRIWNSWRYSKCSIEDLAWINCFTSCIVRQVAAKSMAVRAGSLSGSRFSSTCPSMWRMPCRLKDRIEVHLSPKIRVKSFVKPVA